MFYCLVVYRNCHLCTAEVKYWVSFELDQVCYLYITQFTSLEKEIEGHKEEIKKSQTEVAKLNGVITNLQKDIQGLKKEIQERDETIQVGHGSTDTLTSVLHCSVCYDGVVKMSCTNDCLLGMLTHFYLFSGPYRTLER